MLCSDAIDLQGAGYSTDRLQFKRSWFAVL